MKRYEQLTKKQLIEFVKSIRPKADAYDRVCQMLGIEKDILGYVRRLKANDGGESASPRKRMVRPFCYICKCPATRLLVRWSYDPEMATPGRPICDKCPIGGVDLTLGYSTKSLLNPSLERAERSDDTLQDSIRQIRIEMRYPKSERVLRCQMVLQAGGCPVEKLEEATIECLKSNEKAEAPK